VLAWFFLNADDAFAGGAWPRTPWNVLPIAIPIVAVGVRATPDYIDASTGRPSRRCRAHRAVQSFTRCFTTATSSCSRPRFSEGRRSKRSGALIASLNWTMDYDALAEDAERFKDRLPAQTPVHYRWLRDNKTASGASARVDEIESVLARRGLGAAGYVSPGTRNLYLQESRRSLASAESAARWPRWGSATRTLLSLHRAVLSMMRPRTWQIIRTGQLLPAPSAEPDARLK